jgi:CAAX protease family protein
MAHSTSITQPQQRLSVRHILANHPLTGYFVLAYALMWMFALPLTLSRNQGIGLLPYDLPDGAGNALFLLTTFSGPTVAALVVTGLTDGRGAVKQLLARCLQWRVGIGWYLVALGANLLIWLLSYSAIVGPRLLSAAVTHASLLLTTFLPFVALGILIPAIAEEPGWRGFALPRLQRRHGPLVASLILGTLHGLWHLPALFTVNFGPLPLANLLPFVLTAAVATVSYTWVYNHTGGSILIAMLFHASGNAATGWLTALLKDSGLPVPHQGLAGSLAATGWINVIAYGVAALLLIVLTRGRLGYAPDGMAQSTDARTITQAA